MFASNYNRRTGSMNVTFLVAVAVIMRLRLCSSTFLEHLIKFYYSQSLNVYLNTKCTVYFICILILLFVICFLAHFITDGVLVLNNYMMQYLLKDWFSQKRKWCKFQNSSLWNNGRIMFWTLFNAITVNGN